MRVLVLAPALYDTSPGQRFRIEQWARHLENDGFHFDFVPFEDEPLHRVIHRKGRLFKKGWRILKAFARRFRLLASAKDYDVIFLFREAALLGPAFVESRVASRGIPMIFDFDDAIWVSYVSPSNRCLSVLKCAGKAAKVCRFSDCVTVGNPYLAEYARRHNRNVSIIPTTIDTRHYQPRDYSGTVKNGCVTIGWTGSYSTVQHLHTLRNALITLRKRHRFRLHVIGAQQYDLDGVETFAQPWQANTEVRDLQNFDIGVMPLPDNKWSRGKCGLKLLQCMAVGVPVVGSPVGVNSEIVDDGSNGFLARTDEEWVEKLSLLIEDEDLRRRLGLAGRRVVEERYSTRVWAPRFAELLESVASSARNHANQMS